MTYAIVIAILILSLFAVVVAVVFMTDDDHVPESHELPAPSADQPELNQIPPPPVAVDNMHQKET
jgi:hypothetical protein